MDISKQYEEDMIIRMAHHSSGIEGNSISMSDTITILKEGRTVEGYDIREFFEIYNHKQAFESLMDHLSNNAEMSVSLMKELHGKLTDNILITSGRFKENENYILGSDIDTVAPHLAESTMYQWSENLNYQLQHCNTRKDKVKTILKSHVEFERHHPFDDGNGRTGRMLMIYSMMQHDIPPLIISKDEKSQYKRFLEEMSPYNPEYDAAAEEFTNYALGKIDKEESRMKSFNNEQNNYLTLDKFIEKEESKRSKALEQRKNKRKDLER